MSRKALLLAASAALTLAAAAAPALAQDATIDARVREGQTRIGADSDPETAILTGSGDLVLLAPTRLWTFSLDFTPEWTNNAQLSPDGGEVDTILTGQASIGVATRIAGKLGVHAQVSALFSRYQRDRDLSYDAVTADIGADYAWALGSSRLTVAAGYAPALIYEEGFSRRQLTQHRVYTAAQLVTPLTRPVSGRRYTPVALITSISADRTWADPADYDNWSASASASLVVAPRPDIQLSVGGAYYWRDYDDYFSGFLGVDRRDHGWRAFASANWDFAPNMSMQARYSHVDNRSTSDINPFRADSGGLTVRLAARF